jgi:hypothetical protein
VIWNRGDLDAADELFAPHYMNHYGLIARAGDRPIPIHAWQRDVQDCAFGLKRSALQLTVFVPDTTVVPKCTLSIAPRHRLPP